MMKVRKFMFTGLKLINCIVESISITINISDIRDMIFIIVVLSCVHETDTLSPRFWSVILLPIFGTAFKIGQY